LIQVPYFNGPIFLENKAHVGKVEEIFGAVNSVVSKRECTPLPLNQSQHFTVKLSDGVLASSYKAGGNPSLTKEERKLKSFQETSSI
jgi:hypothetical protein